MVHAIQPGMMILILFLILTAILRKEWIAAGFIVLVIGFQSWATSDYWFDGLIGAVLGSLILLAVTRLGLLAASVMFFVLNLCSDTAFTSDIGAWHSTPTMLAILSIVALAGFGFYTSLAGRPIFADALLQE